MTVVRGQTTGDVAGPLQPNPDVTAQHGYDNGTIVRMAKAGLAENIIIQSIQSQPARYDVSPDGLIALQQAGVSANVIAAMQAKSSGFAVRSADGPKGVGGKTGVVPGALGPALEELGVYYKDKTGDWTPLKTEKAIQKSGGFIKSTLTDGIIKKDTNGYVYGPHSPLVIPKGSQILIYAPSGVDAAEYDFIRFREKKDSREFRAMTGGVIHSQSGAERDDLKEIHPERLTLHFVRVRPRRADIIEGAAVASMPPGIVARASDIDAAGFRASTACSQREPGCRLRTGLNRRAWSRELVGESPGADPYKSQPEAAPLQLYASEVFVGRFDGQRLAAAICRPRPSFDAITYGAERETLQRFIVATGRRCGNAQLGLRQPSPPANGCPTAEQLHSMLDRSRGLLGSSPTRAARCWPPEATRHVPLLSQAWGIATHRSAVLDRVATSRCLGLKLPLPEDNGSRLCHARGLQPGPDSCVRVHSVLDLRIEEFAPDEAAAVVARWRP